MYNSLVLYVGYFSFKYILHELQRSLEKLVEKNSFGSDADTFSDVGIGQTAICSSQTISYTHFLFAASINNSLPMRKTF